MAVETLLHQPVKLFRASYENIKITTPEDLVIADGPLEKKMWLEFKQFLYEASIDEFMGKIASCQVLE